MKPQQCIYDLTRALILFMAGLTFSLGSQVASAKAHTGFSINPNLYYGSSTSDDSVTGDSELTLTYYDIKIGYTASSGLYVGAIYSQETEDSGSSDQSRSSYGASVGYDFSNGAYVHANYYLASARTDFDDAERGEGTGLQLDLGYEFRLNKSFALGPQLSYKTYTYGTHEPDGGSESDRDLDETNILPMINLSFMF